MITGFSGRGFVNIQAFGYCLVRHTQEAQLFGFLGYGLVFWYAFGRLNDNDSFDFSKGSNWLQSRPPFFLGDFNNPLPITQIGVVANKISDYAYCVVCINFTDFILGVKFGDLDLPDKPSRTIRNFS